MTIEYIPAKTIISKNKSGAWFGTDYNMNIYKGCSHGCIYCDSRSDCYHVDNFDQVRAKKDALRIIRDELKKKVKKGVIGTGSMSDPYNPFEKNLKLTGNSLELINAYNFGVAIATKSPLITRDIEVLKDIARHSPVLVKMTITTFDDELSKIIEPNVAVSSKRFEALKELADNGIYCGIIMMPILPFINDTKQNVIEIVRKAKASNVKFIYPAFGVTLRNNQRDYYYEKLDKHFPNLKEKYIKRYGYKYSCGSPKAKELYSVLAEQCTNMGMLHNMKNIINDYKRPYQHTQLSFF